MNQLLFQSGALREPIAVSIAVVLGFILIYTSGINPRTKTTAIAFPLAISSLRYGGDDGIKNKVSFCFVSLRSNSCGANRVTFCFIVLLSFIRFAQTQFYGLCGGFTLIRKNF